MIALLLTTIVFSASAVTINLTGKVKNASGKAISGAIVVLDNQNMTDTTDATGTYSFKKGTVAVSRMSQIPLTQSIELNNGTISINLSGISSVKVELFDVHGSLISRELNSTAPAGNYQFNLMNRNLASSMILAKVSLGNEVTTFQYFPFGNKGRKLRASNKAFSEKTVLAKASEIIDTIKVSSTGYLPGAKQISSYEGTMDITLDSSTLKLFSFFVTSQKALEKLSGSTKGFGGDFRFGKTGQGAGLLGADSICECIAEMSMPGSKVKKWRAFLSVEKGPEGTQVNAIDRIGKGPWYDRTGRLLANELSELTAGNRPINADEDIINDLPNEDGIPNHRPDPTQPAVDNHHMVTGSNKQGKLNSNTSTCDDWTSVTSSDRPMCGFSWPRGMGGGGGSHWISGFQAGGCKAGTHTTNDFGGERGIIGSDGGYGGFYCFALVP
jgi:hypothetical protein